jgi:hypothetical protein
MLFLFLTLVYVSTETNLLDSDWARQPRRSVFWQSWNNDWFSTPVWNLILSSSGEKFLNRHAVKAHEVRALASSWALFNSASISEVLSAGFWRCQDSFTSFYLT